ncbi:MFS transporter [Vibrio sp. DW001]|uniref:MFS transporter n=1 Tax=Vibrio sp. DW001 TaxID=2912315 RepID=UPI0023B0F960|nr:MFS transporter [Vibrio sp. DW001]WED28496.1 MFS transporter [Vibrio sp. DW001]
MKERVYEKRWETLFFLLLANSLNLIDITIMNVAIPSIVRDLEATVNETQWITIIYLLAFASGLFPFGKLGDLKGKKNLFTIGLIGFMLSSLMCSFATSIEFLLASRFFQGLFSAVMVPQVLGIANSIFQDHEKSRMYGVVGGVGSTASMLGPLVGGLLISLNLFELDWRSIFLINFPIGLISLVGLRNNHVEKHSMFTNESVDWLGIALFVCLSISLIFPLIEGHNLNWPFWIKGLLFMAFPLTITLAFWVVHCNKTHHSSLLPARLYQNKEFIYNLIVLMIFSSSIPGLFLALAFYLQQHLEFSAFQTGLAVSVFPLGAFSASMILKQLDSSWNKLRIFLGGQLLSLSIFFVAINVEHVTKESGVTMIMFLIVFSGFGMGSAIIALMHQTMITVNKHDSGSASGAMQALQYIGMAISIGTVGQLFLIEIQNSQNYQIAFQRSAILSSSIFLAVSCYLGLELVIEKLTKTRT